MSRWIDYPGPLWAIYSLFAFLCLVLVTAIFGSILLICILVFRAGRRFQTVYMRTWFRFVLWIYRTRVSVKGLKNHDPKIPALVVSNHQSHLDIPVCFVTLLGDIRMVAKKELFRIPIFGQVITHTEFISVDRGSKKSGSQAVAEIGRSIADGIHVWIAPEGTRSRSSRMGPFKRGSFVAAIRAGIPVQPIVVENSFEALPPRAKLVRPGVTIRFRILPRLQPRPTDDAGEFAAHVRNLMAAELSGDALAL